MARLVSLVEDAHPALREVMAALAPHTGRAHVVGLTGSPGVGKSTTTSALIAAYRAQFRFHRYADRMAHLHHFPGLADVLFITQG